MFVVAAEGLEGVGDGEEGKDGTATVGTDIKEETSKGMIRFRIYKTSPRTSLRTTDANLFIAQWFGMVYNLLTVKVLMLFSSRTEGHQNLHTL